MTWRQALEASIVIWRKRAKGKIVDSVCPLCIKASIKTSSGYCDSCIAGGVPGVGTRGACFPEFYKWLYGGCTKNQAEAILAVLIKLRKHPKCRIKKKKIGQTNKVKADQKGKGRSKPSKVGQKAYRKPQVGVRRRSRLLGKALDIRKR